VFCLNHFPIEKPCEVCSKIADCGDSARNETTTAGWDIIILTASNEKQAWGYSKQIEYRLSKGLLPSAPHYAVLPDTEGKRLGSGGAVFNALRYIRENSDSDACFADKRILVINSGGDSKRAPQYSASGKIFAPVARELAPGICAMLFDEIILSVAELPSRIPAGLMTLTGDILLAFDLFRIEFNECGAAAISVKEDVLKGTNHGVFIPDGEGYVKRFMHKSALADLQIAEAIVDGNQVHLDTGAIWFGNVVIEELYKLISTGGKVDDDKFYTFTNEKAQLSFYADFVYPMARDSSLDRFYLEKPEGGYTEELRFCRTELWKVLHKYPMKIVDLSPAHFIHFGTTTEILKIMTTDIEKYAYLGWKREVNTNAVTSGRFSSNNSYIDEKSQIDDGCYIEKSSIYNSTIGKNCVVSNSTLHSAKIPDNTVIHSLKQNDGSYVARIYGVQDNPKLDIDKGGTFLGIPFREFMHKHKMKVADLWDSTPYTLWDAKLFFLSYSLDESLCQALQGYSEYTAASKLMKRISLKESSLRADIVNIPLSQDK
jgi:fucokinase